MQGGYGPPPGGGYGAPPPAGGYGPPPGGGGYGPPPGGGGYGPPPGGGGYGPPPGGGPPAPAGGGGGGLAPGAAQVLKDRSFGMVLLLTIVTCGIYGIVVRYQMTDELRQATGDNSLNPGMDLLISLLFCPWMFFVMYRNSQKYAAAFKAAGVQRGDNSTTVLLLAIFGLSIVSEYFLIEDHNALCRLARGEQVLPTRRDRGKRAAMRSPVSFCALALLVAGCASSPPEAPKAAPPVASSAPRASAAADVAPVPQKPAFENPGGMWMPAQLKEQTETLKRLGVTDPALLSDPMSPVLSAIVFLGGCSASFVSPEGLVVTNHHCVQGALQYNSTPEHNLIEGGYLAKTQADEKSAGPAARIFVTQAISDVTPQVLAGLDAEKDDRARYKKIEQKQKEIVAACEKDRPDVRCTVAKYFEGASYYKVEQLEIRDVRLVYAPSAGIGNYGGEIDNWRWPRHTGDFSFYRAYVGPDGKPADFSKDNVPFKPKHVLKLASKPLEEGDFVMVAGYPGRTSRWKTALEVREAVEWSYPRRIRTFDEWIKVIAGLSADKEIAIKAEPLNRGLGNYLTNSKGQLEGLQKGGLLDQREKQERDLVTWVDADPARKAAYGDALKKQRELLLAAQKTREKDAALGELLRFSQMFGAAMTIVRMAEERPKPDAEREPDYQARNWRRLKQSLVAMTRQYHRTLDREMFVSVLAEALKVPEAERSELVALVGGKAPSVDSLKKEASKLFAKPTLEDEKARVTMFEKATTKELVASKDPLIQLALRARPLVKEMETRQETLAGALALVRPKYVEAVKKSSAAPLSPDANATLRITYGTVRGYKPTPDAPTYRPFSTLSEVVKKHTGKEPFAAPKGLLDVAGQKKLGPYADAKLGDVPVDFLADLHITGGNSGSATLNAKGELVGLVFDGNYEAMASDWVFVPAITRSIHVDLRYILWVMDAVDGADHLLKEMGVNPSL